MGNWKSGLATAGDALGLCRDREGFGGNLSIVTLLGISGCKKRLAVLSMSKKRSVKYLRRCETRQHQPRGSEASTGLDSLVPIWYPTASNPIATGQVFLILVVKKKNAE